MKISINGMDLEFSGRDNISIVNGQFVNSSKNTKNEPTTDHFISFNTITEIDSNTTFDIEIDNSKENKDLPKDVVKVIASNQDYSKIKLTENNGVLSVRSDSGSFGEVTIKVSTSQLNKIKLSGTGDLTGYFQGKELNISSSGTSDVSLSGLVEQLTIKNSGTGDMTLNELESSILELNNSGTGDLSVWATKNISGKNSGTGDIKYYGIQNSSIKNNGIGDVKFKGEKATQKNDSDVNFFKTTEKKEEAPKEVFPEPEIKEPPKKSKYRL
jgi:hypothetical protein